MYQGQGQQFYLGEKNGAVVSPPSNNCILDGECFASIIKLTYLNLGCGCCVWICMCSMREAYT